MAVTVRHGGRIYRESYVSKKTLLPIAYQDIAKLGKFHRVKSIVEGMSQMATLAHPQND